MIPILNWISANGNAAFWLGLFLLIVFDRLVTLILGLRKVPCCACECHEEVCDDCEPETHSEEA
jgi:hypothetical protein